MKANELRTGNWVTDSEHLKGDFQVKSIREEHIFQGDWWINLDIIRPIELTEELLLKFGFEPHVGAYLNNVFKKVPFSFTCLKDTGWNLMIESFLGGYSLKSQIQYVHQLQNLYFALTGEELELVSGEDFLK